MTLPLPRPGDRIGDYLVEREIARGGAGVVFRAKAPDGARRALKLFLEDLNSGVRRQRFEREVSIEELLKIQRLREVLTSESSGGAAQLGALVKRVSVTPEAAPKR